MERQITAEEFEAEAMPHLDDLYRTTVRLVRDRTEAEDIVQEVFMQAWKSFRKYEPGTNCRAWLYKILFNKVDHHRRRRQVRARWVEENDDFAFEAVATAQVVSAELTDAEVLAALDALPARYREVVLLADVEELSYKETSEVLGVPLGTVMSRLSRARRRLRDALAGVARGYGIKVAEAETALAA